MKRRDATTTAREVAQYFVAVQDQKAGELMTLLKLQKLLYYAQGTHLALYGKPLFRETVEAWPHGPVVREVWEEYRVYKGAKPIPHRADAPALPETAMATVERVQAAYGQYSAWKLRDMTHREAPWVDAIAAAPDSAIKEDAMESFFRAKLMTPSSRPLSWSEALKDPAFREAVDEGLSDLAAGRTVPWAEVERSLPSA